MKKAKRIVFSGNGPFSSINMLTTNMSMIDAINNGLGGDGLKGSKALNSDSSRGIKDYHEIANKK